MFTNHNSIESYNISVTQRWLVRDLSLTFLSKILSLSFINIKKFKLKRAFILFVNSNWIS